MIRGILDEVPDISGLDVSPQGLETTIYDTDGNVIQTLVSSGANRSLVSYDQIPEDLVNAFVAIEDSRFWTHEGVDVKGIFRAALVGLSSGRFSEGASTITQQLIKNNVFDGGSESTFGARLIRKIQEQYLALQLETVMSKEQILENYLNTINLGSNCLGVQKAAQRYFNKDVSELTLSECAVIAGITQNPYSYNPILYPEKNAERRQKVLDNMEELGYITAEEKAEALADDVYDRIAEVNRNRSSTSTVYSYFVDRLINDVLRDLEEAGYTSDQATSMLYSGGLQIYTTQDSTIQAIVDEELANESNYSGINQKYSFTYQVTIVHSDNTSNTYYTQSVKNFSGLTYLEFDTKTEIEELIESFKKSVMADGDVASAESLDITLQPQVSVVVMDQSTGYVKAIAGGRGEKTASLSLNRATNTFRQPGSTFKVLAAFAPALEEGVATLATTYYDEPYTVTWEGTTWSPSNWYSSKKYAGYANIRQGIIYSMNIIAVRCLVESVGVDTAFEYVENFGINTLIDKTTETASTGLYDRRPTLALGGLTQGVTNMQLTAAYATIANGGTYIEPILYTKILDNEGNVILSNEPETHTVISETTAYLLTNAMSDSLESSTLNGLFSSSSSQAKLTTGLAAAGKSGTTSDYNDLWFVGYTPYYTMGIWSGFDDNAKFSSSDNRNFHKVIWRKIMERITADLPVVDFTVPDGIVSCTICTKSGLLATDACRADGRSCIVSTEYFASGTQPTTYCDLHVSYEVCAVSGLLPSEDCETLTTSYIILPETTSGTTQDDEYATVPTDVCTICSEAAAAAEDSKQTDGTSLTDVISDFINSMISGDD